MEKAIKKAFKRAKRKYVTLWKTLTLLLMAVSLVFSAGAAVLRTFDNNIAATYGGSFWKLKDADGTARYFNADFNSAEELTAYAEDLCRRVEAEGAVLLMNRNNALPLAYGSQLSCFVDAAEELRTALENGGFGVYTKGIAETPWSTLPQEVKESVAAYGDAAVLVFSCGEALDQNQKDLLKDVAELKAAGTVKRIVVLLDTDQAVQADFLRDPQYDIDACLRIGNGDAVAEILAGKVNPSGRLTATYYYGESAFPAATESVTYAGYDGENIPAHAAAYTVCHEGIYTDYKYYETRYEDFVTGQGNAGIFLYEDVVAYPFGYGLSYTNFAYSGVAGRYNAATDCFEISVTVTNTGKIAGREVVQVYTQSPYTPYDREHQVEKASVMLCGFEKTEILEPGTSQTVTVRVEKGDLASYDAYGKGTYILEAGNYYLTVAADSHRAVNQILAAKGYTAETTVGKMDGTGDAALVWRYIQETFDAETYAVSENGTKIENQLSDADLNLYEGRGENQVTYLSRRDWEGTFLKETARLTLTAQMIRDLQDLQYDPAEPQTAEMPTLGVKGGYTLYKIRGVPYDDPKWESLLDQLKFDEMVRIIGDAYRWRMPVVSVEAPGARDGSVDLPLPSWHALAATFDTDLMAEVGRVIGNRCLQEGVSCLYGPDIQSCGADSLLAGKTTAAAVKAIRAKGIDVALESFGPKGSFGLGVWMGEQAAREGWLRLFRDAFEEGNADGVMIANTRLGCRMTGGHRGLMTDILQVEWGCSGLAVADHSSPLCVSGADGLLAGVSVFAATHPTVVNQLSGYKNDPAVVCAMREACHRNLYTMANSAAMNGVGAKTTVRPTDLPVAANTKAVAIVAAVLALGCLAMWVSGAVELRKTQEYAAYRAEKNN